MCASELVIVTTTFAEKIHATEMAKRVIVQRAAACAQVEGPIESHYFWNGQVCLDYEWRLTIKTTRERLDQLSRLVHESHPYAVPQWVVVAVERSSAGYESWVHEAVAGGGDLSA